MEKSFLNTPKPLITAMILDPTPEGAKAKITKAINDGADAIGIQLEFLKQEYRTEKILKDIFSACQGLPIYITSYRGNESGDMSDEKCVELLLFGLKCGATLCDIMADTFDHVDYEISFKEEAVKKQKALAKKIHELGGEVIFSSHLHAFFDEEDVMKFAFAQQERGADIVKIVSFAQNEEQMIADIKIIKRMKAELSKPFLFLANGERCHLLRQMGPTLGVCTYLCKTDNGTEQQEVKTIKYLRDEM